LLIEKLTLNSLLRLEQRIERGWRLGLNGMRALLDKLGRPEFPVILVAGTNGKGSVCSALHNYFRERGFKTGLTTSPHLCDIKERIVINGAPISQPDFERIYEKIESLDDQQATYFETLSAMAIEYFKEEKVDVAIVEVGLGGRLDAFNVLDPVLSVITSVGLEHTQWLGDTLEKIAVEKAGIVRKGRPAILGTNLPALKNECNRIGAESHIVKYNFDSFRNLNIEIAVKSAELFCRTQNLKFEEDFCREACSRANWPGRFQIIQSNPTVILDAAHNPHAAEALHKLLLQFSEKKIVALAAFLNDKDHQNFIRILDDRVNQWVITEVSNKRGLNAEEVKAPSSAIKISNLFKAYEKALSLVDNESILLVTGSIYLLGEFLKLKYGENCGPFPPEGKI